MEGGEKERGFDEDIGDVPDIDAVGLGGEELTEFKSDSAFFHIDRIGKDIPGKRGGDTDDPSI